MDATTIAAVATPPGIGGIAIIRISGPAAVPIARRVFRPAGGGDGLASWRLHYGHAIDPENGKVLDEVLLAVMRAPRSYTREDVVEINSHGGPQAVREIMRVVLQSGAVLAAPGEFTRRAFMNGRIDLTQAEAVADLIQAESAAALRAAAALAGGALRREIEALESVCTALLAELNAAIDFPEETEKEAAAAVGELSREVSERLVVPLRRLLRSAAEGRPVREGLTVTIVGRPNVGKSSLLNRLLGRDRAIVTPYPGTTRDVVAESLLLRGIVVHLSDTAGIHASTDPIEAAGIARAIAQAELADAVLLVLEADRPILEADLRLWEAVKEKPRIVVFNKADRLSPAEAPPSLPPAWRPVSAVTVSALTGEGIEGLRESILSLVAAGGGASGGGEVIPNLRQSGLMREALEASQRAAAALASGLPLECAAVDLAETLSRLGEVIGRTAAPDILGRIFERFCIGK